jgi:hypothetical protein
MADALMIERAECSLIWFAESNDEVIDFCGDTTPMALLGLRLVNAPRVEATGTTPGYSWDLRR